MKNLFIKICETCYDSNMMNNAIFISRRLSNKLKLGSYMCTKCYDEYLDDLKFKKDYVSKKPSELLNKL